MFSILMPTDFSENSMNAIKYALEFFKYHKTKFYFMHAYQNEFYDSEELIAREDYDTVLGTISNQSQKELESLLTKVKVIAPNPKYTYHTISAFNTLVEEANSIADKYNIDLIVMGTKGKSNERHIVFGSRTFQVLKYVQCPVLAIPANYTNTQPKHFLFPTNYLIPNKRRELKLLSNLAKPYRSQIDVLYISKSDKLSLRQEDNKAFIQDTLREVKVNFCVEDSRSIAESIKNHISKNNIDLIAMVNTQHSFLEDMLFPSEIDKVSLGLDIPLLALQNTTRN